MNYKPFIDIAFKEAMKASNHNDVPVGAVIIKNNKIISRGHNQCIQKMNATLHAEIIVINKACKSLGNWRLDDCILITTLEPCCMCVGAILQSRIHKVIFTSLDKKAGCVLSQYTLLDDRLLKQVVEYEYIKDDRSPILLKDFFTVKRDNQ